MSSSTPAGSYPDGHRNSEGRNATAEQQMVYFEELDRLDILRTYNPQGLSIVAPSVLQFGSPEQCEQWVLPTLRAEISWCLGLSEPGAGSDLGGLSTRAVLDGDHFVINGQKVWTSGAGNADYCWCFVRTDPDAPKHRGISCVIVPMHQDGIEFRPLPPLTSKDRADFGEVFFTDVMAPVFGRVSSEASITVGECRWGSSRMSRRTAVDALCHSG